MSNKPVLPEPDISPEFQALWNAIADWEKTINVDDGLEKGDLIDAQVTAMMQSILEQGIAYGREQALANFSQKLINRKAAIEIAKIVGGLTVATTADGVYMLSGVDLERLCNVIATIGREQMRQECDSAKADAETWRMKYQALNTKSIGKALGDAFKAMDSCSNNLRLLGKPYPRTCAKCGLGPCKDPIVAQENKELP